MCEEILNCHIKERPGEKLELIFDTNKIVAPLVTQFFAHIKASVEGTDREYIYKNVMPSLPSFVDEKVSLPVQAADLLAWFFRRIRTNSAANINWWKVWEIIQDMPYNFYEIDSGYLEESRDSLLAKPPEKHMFYHQIEKHRETLDEQLSRDNLAILKGEDGTGSMVKSISTNRMKRYQLVSKCQNEDNPHLHSKKGNRCLASPSWDQMQDHK